MPEAYQIKDQYAMHFLTFTVVFWLDIFTRELYRNVLIESFKYCREKRKLMIYGYVIMSNHVHLLVQASNGDLSEIIRDLKRHTSRTIINAIITENESRRSWLLSEMRRATSTHKRNKKYQLWTHNNHAVEMYNNFMMDQRLNYIHQNPVKAGIVDKPENYIYSSARNYLGIQNSVIEIDILDP